jgi:hypothetical protein
MSLPLLNFVVPGDQDILCGRAQSFFNHPGNVRFREIVARHMSEYACAETKGAKTSVVREVVRKIWSEGGKFLKLDKVTNRWFESDALCATSKVGHAFRDAIAEQQVHSAREPGEREKEPRVDSGSDNDSPNELASPLLLLGRAAIEIASGQSGHLEQVRWNPPKDSPAGTSTTDELTKSQSVTGLQESTKSSDLEGSRASNRVPPTKQTKLKNCLLSKDNVSGGKRVLSKSSYSSKSSLGCSHSVGFKNVPLSTNSAKNSIRSIEAQAEINQSSNSGGDFPTVVPPNLPFHVPQLGPSNRKSLLSRRALQSSAPLSQSNLNGDSLRAYSKSGLAMPSVLTAQDPEPQQFMVPSLHQRLPGMMYTHELKKVMYQTLALRQKALEQKTANQGCTNESAHANVGELIEKAKASTKSPSEILKEALAAQTSSLIINCGTALELQGKGINQNSTLPSVEPQKPGELPFNDSSMESLAESALPRSAEQSKHSNEASNDNNVTSIAESALPTTDQQKHGKITSNDSHVKAVAGSERASGTAIVSPDSLKNLCLPPNILPDLRGTKRRRSPDVNTTVLSKRRVPLAQVATDYTIQSQNCLGSFCTFSFGVDESATSMYFL